MNKYLLSTIILLSFSSYTFGNTHFNVVIDPNSIKITNDSDLTPENPDVIKCGIGEGETRRSLIKKIKNGEDVTKVCTSNITDFSSMFDSIPNFNQDVSNWDVSNGVDFSYMFGFATSFNQDISKWNVSKGTTFHHMFYYATSFNQPLNDWNVSNSSSFSSMFSNALAFNQPLNKWNVHNCSDFKTMFYYATNFNQNISNWNVSNATVYDDFAKSTPLKPEYMPHFN